MFKLSAIQMVSTDSVDENLKLAGDLIRQAAADGSKIVALPENFALMGMHEKDKLAIVEEYGQGPIQSFLADTAREHGVYLLGGTIPIKASADKVYASSLLFSPVGECIGRYDKIHLFDVSVSNDESYLESDVVLPGDSPLVVNTEFGFLGLSVCYDLRFAELYRGEVTDGAVILFVPSAFTEMTGRAHWEVLLRARAIENLCYVVAPNQGGVHSNGRETYGHTMVVDYWGRVENCLEKGNGVVTATIDLDALREQRQLFPAVNHRRL